MCFMSPGSIGLKSCSEYQFCKRLEAAIDNFGNIIRFQSSMYGWDEIIKWKKKNDWKPTGHYTKFGWT